MKSSSSLPLSDRNVYFDRIFCWKFTPKTENVPFKQGCKSWITLQIQIVLFFVVFLKDLVFLYFFFVYIWSICFFFCLFFLFFLVFQGLFTSLPLVRFLFQFSTLFFVPLCSNFSSLFLSYSTWGGGGDIAIKYTPLLSNLPEFTYSKKWILKFLICVPKDVGNIFLFWEVYKIWELRSH